jgi:hypothetical protein
VRLLPLSRLSNSAGAPSAARRCVATRQRSSISELAASWETLGGEHRVKAARFPQTKTLDDFDFTHQRSVSRQQIAHLHQLDFLREAKT